jgi:hypothetical protein
MNLKTVCQSGNWINADANHHHPLVNRHRAESQGEGSQSPAGRRTVSHFTPIFESRRCCPGQAAALALIAPQTVHPGS